MVKEFTFGTPNNYIGDITTFNNKLYFSVDDGVNGRELWSSDGTTAGTTLVQNLVPGVFGSDPRSMVVYGNSMYLTYSDPTYGRQLFKMDAAENFSLVKEIYPSAGDAQINNMYVANNTLYFSATSPQYGTELWSSDGTEVGTNVFDIASGTNSSNPNYFHWINNKLIFRAQTATSGYEVFVSDGTTLAGTGVLKDIVVGSGSSYPWSLYEFNGKIYFTAYDAVHGTELWLTDGTEAGTTLVMDLNPGIADGFNVNAEPELYMASFNSRMYLFANDGTHGDELMILDQASTAGLTEGTTANFNLFPNPATTSFTLTNLPSEATIQLIDQTGRIVTTENTTTQTQSIATNTLHSGIYFVHVTGKNGETSTQKLVIE
ncbi:MAG: T9SS type A sorting domain-containing protein [Crocinitomicaceae bacterium]